MSLDSARRMAADRLGAELGVDPASLADTDDSNRS
jgi:hypothetical protein